MGRVIKIRDDNGKPVTIGIVDGGTLTLHRKKSTHFFRKYNAWGIDRRVIEGLDDVLGVMLHDDESKVKYYVKREYFLQNSFPVHYGGHREQLLLPIDKWRVV